MNLFQIAPQDQSVYYLQYIFGSVGTVLKAQVAAGGDPSATVVNIVGVMLKYINTLALAVGAIMVIYVVVVGLLKTAAEGEFLGKHWNSLWVPVRTVIGIASLFPTASGYSGLQVVMMWIIVQGVAAGDTLWTTALNYTNIMGSPFATFTVPSVAVAPNMQNLYKALACQATAQVGGSVSPLPKVNFGSTTFTPATTYGSNQNYFYCSDHSSDAPNPNSGQNFCNGSMKFEFTSDPTTWPATVPLGVTSALMVDLMPPSGSAVSNADASCGSLSVCDYNAYCTPPNPGVPTSSTKYSELGCYVCKQQRAVIQTIINQVLLGEAQAYANADAQYITFFHQNIPVSQYVQTPTWIANACKSQGIPNDQCCSLSGAPWLSLCPTTTQSKAATKFFESYQANLPSGTKAYWSNTANTTVNGLYWPNGLQNLAITSGTGSSSGSTSSGTGSTTASDFISAAVSQYTQTISTAITNYISGQSASSPALSGWMSNAQQNGWLLAGAYYYELTSMDSQNQNSIPSWSAVASDPTNSSSDGPLYKYRSNVQGADALLQIIVKQQNSSSGSSSGSSFASAASQVPQLGSVANLSNTAGTGILQAFQQLLLGTSAISNNAGNNPTNNGMITNPLVRLHAFGEALMITGDVLFVAVSAIILVLLLTSGWGVFVAGFGIQTPSDLGSGLMIFLLPLIYLFIGSCYVFGGLIAVYTPLIPYIIYSMGAVGWMMATIEAMVAMPFVALGIMSPGGEHEVMGRSHHALSHIFNLFLRPTLMVFGMMASMLLAAAGVTMVNSSFSGVMSTIGGAWTTQGNPEPVELFMFIAAYVMLILTVLNKCFTLIYVIPERILTWIGMQPVQYGEADALSGIKSAVEGAGSAAAGQMAGAVKGLGDRGLTAQTNAYKNANAKKQEGQGTNISGGPSTNLLNNASNNTSNNASNNASNNSGGGGGGTPPPA